MSLMLNDNSAEISRMQQSIDQLEQDARQWQQVQIFDAQGQIYTVMGLPTGGFDLAGSVAPFGLIPTTADAGAPPPPRIEVIYGEIDGEPISGMSLGTRYLISPSNGNHVYIIVTRDETTRAITSRTIGFGASIPDDSETLLHIDLGKVELAEGSYTITKSGWIGNIYPSEEIIVINGALFYRTAQSVGREPMEIEV